MTKRDFVPDSHKNLHGWAVNYAAQLSPIAVRVSWPTAKVNTLTANLDTLNTATQAVLDTAIGQLAAAKAGVLGPIRLDTKNLKSTTGFTEGDATALGVYTTPETFNRETYRPALDATAHHGYVELVAKKLGADSLNVYWQPEGTAPWHLLAAKRVRFPFHDETPAPAGPTLQAREYMVIGVIGDEEIGNPSNIAAAVFQA